MPSHTARTRTTRALTAGALVAALTFTGCAGPTDDDTAAGGPTVDNCGIEVPIDPAPDRIYAAYQPAIEIVHALGLGDRLSGTAFLDAEVLPEYADAQAQTEYLPSLPSRDELLAQEPDFVLSGYNGVFAADGSGKSFGTRASLTDLGVRSWILSPLCPSEDGMTDEAIDPATVDLETLHDDIRSLGAIFGVEQQAEEVIADQVDRLATVKERVRDLDRPTVAFLTIKDDGTLSTAGGIDFGTRIIEAAGGVNVFADLTERRNIEVDVEEVIRRNPDVILTSSCCDTDLNLAGAEPDADAIRGLPALAGVSAIRNNQVHAFLFADRAAGVRVAHSVELLADILHPQGA